MVREPRNWRSVAIRVGASGADITRYSALVGRTGASVGTRMTNLPGVANSISWAGAKGLVMPLASGLALPVAGGAVLPVALATASSKRSAATTSS